MITVRERKVLTMQISSRFTMAIHMFACACVDTFSDQKKCPDFKDEEHEKAWFIRTAINLPKDYLKSYWVSKTDGLKSDIPCEDGE